MVYPGGMSRGRHATPVKLARKERQELQSLIRRTTAAQRDVTRARIALMAHEGYTSAAISQELGVSVQTVSQWRQRIARQGAQGIPLPGSGSLDEIAQVVVTLLQPYLQPDNY